MVCEPPPAAVQVRQLCVGIPSELKAPDGSELDEFMHCKEHPLARMLHDLSSTENARPPPRMLRSRLLDGAAHRVMPYHVADNTYGPGSQPSPHPNSLPFSPHFATKCSYALHAEAHQACPSVACCSGVLRMGAVRVADKCPMRAQSTQTLSTPMRVIVSHPEHDSIYVNDLACRSFGRETLRSLCNLMLENLPAGAPRRRSVALASRLPGDPA
jgi:hypothetical protein